MWHAETAARLAAAASAVVETHDRPPLLDLSPLAPPDAVDVIVSARIVYPVQVR
jgi:hypothetical protein